MRCADGLVEVGLVTGRHGWLTPSRNPFVVRGVPAGRLTLHDAITEGRR